MGQVSSYHELKTKEGTLDISADKIKIGLLCETNRGRKTPSKKRALVTIKNSIKIYLRNEYNIPANKEFEWETIDIENSNIILNNVNSESFKFKHTSKYLMSRYHAIFGIHCPIYNYKSKAFEDMRKIVCNMLKPFGLIAFLSFLSDESINSIERTVDIYQNQLELTNFEKEFTFNKPEVRIIETELESDTNNIYLIIYKKNAKLKKKVRFSNDNINDTSRINTSSSSSRTVPPKTSTPKTSTPKTSTPKTSTPKTSTPKTSTPKISTLKISISTKMYDFLLEMIIIILLIVILLFV